jgi:hypothetical protein
MNFIKQVSCLILLFLAFSALGNYSSDISGHYLCKGEDFLNNTTFDEPTSVIKTGNTYFFTWINKDLTFYGTAILQNKTISAVFWTISNANLPGVVTYQVLPNGDLKGKWTVKGAKVTGNEYCKKLQ